MDQALGFEAVERGVQRPYCDPPASAFFDFQADGNAIGILAETEDGEENHLFEFAKITRPHVCSIS